MKHSWPSATKKHENCPIDFKQVRGRFQVKTSATVWNLFLRTWDLLIVAVFAIGCGKDPLSPDSDTMRITIRGTVRYQEMIPTEQGLSPDMKETTCRYALVRAIDAESNVIMDSSYTDSGGVFVLTTRTARREVVQVLSTSGVAGNVNVVNSNRSLYKFADTVEISANTSLNLLIPCDAAAQTSGAFNILDVCIRVAELVGKTTGKTPPLLTACWELGNTGKAVCGRLLNSSFYTRLEGQPWIFLLGGVAGSVTTTQTSHFDDPVIAHEYSHFIQDEYSYANSMGGLHNGENIYYSLALSEGFATWLGCVALGSPFYISTVGMPPTPKLNFSYYSIENVNDISYRAYGYSSEFTVSEILWDIYDGGDQYQQDIDADGLAMPFDKIFAAFTSINKNTEYPYLGLILQKLEQSGTLTQEQIRRLTQFPSIQQVTYPPTVQWPMTMKTGTTYQYDITVPSGIQIAQSSAFVNQFWTFTVQQSCTSTVTLDVTPYDLSPRLYIGLFQNENTLIEEATVSSYPNKLIHILPKGKYIVRVIAERATSYTLREEHSNAK